MRLGRPPTMKAARGEAVERAAAERAEAGREALPVEAGPALVPAGASADKLAVLSGGAERGAPLGRMRRGRDGGGLLAGGDRGTGGGEGSLVGGRICR